MADETDAEIETVTTAADAPEVAELNAPTREVAEQGFAVQDQWPANHRLRAEALVEAGHDADPFSHITPEFIAATKDRLAAEEADEAEADAAEAEAHPPVNARMKKAKLRRIAGRESVALDADDTNATIVTKIEAARAANTSEG